jgi:SAM-dependent methyltransferase
MSSYNRFAEVYDQLMTDIPYAEYVEWIQSYAPVHTYKNLLDIGCGTGTMAQLLASAGYNVSGIDLSEEMLAIAHERLAEQGFDVPLFAMSMAELEGFENVDVAIIPIDSINYVTDEAEVVETLKRIFNSLREGGQLLFDVHSLNYVENYLDGSPFTYDDGEITYIWHTEEGEYEHSVYHQMTFFVANEDGTYDRFDEEHFQRTFPIGYYKQLLQQIGFQHVEVTADFTNEQPTEESSRIFIRAIK